MNKSVSCEQVQAEDRRDTLPNLSKKVRLSDHHYNGDMCASASTRFTAGAREQQGQEPVGKHRACCMRFQPRQAIQVPM